MPHTTARYPFEFKILEAVCRRTGSDTLRVLAHPDGTWLTSDIREPQLREQHESLPVRLYYDPFEPFEYRWLEWRGLSAAVIEAWLGVKLEPADFRDMRGGEDLTAFPEEWGVMF